MSAQSTPLVLSWSRVLVGLFSGRLEIADLDGAVFYFGCTRSHAFDPAGGGTNELTEIAKADPIRGRQVHAALMAEVEKAEAAGRVAWRENGTGYHTYQQLNELLEGLGLPTIDHEDAVGPIYFPRVLAYVKEANLPYRLVTLDYEGLPT